MSLEPQAVSEPQNAVPLPSWEQMTDLDKGAAVLHVRTRVSEGASYAEEHYPCRYFDDPTLTALDVEEACEHAVKVTGGDNAVWHLLGADEYHRLYDMALEAGR